MARMRAVRLHRSLLLPLAASLALACASPASKPDGSVTAAGDEVSIRLTPIQQKAIAAREREHHGTGSVRIALSDKQLASLSAALSEDEVRERVSLLVKPGTVKKKGGTPT